MIYRKPKKKDFTMADNSAIRDKRLSLQSRGLLMFMLSCTDTWDFTAEKLQYETGTKRNRIETALDELEEFGYIKRERKREKGKHRVEITVYEEPRTVKIYLKELKDTDDSLCPF